MFHFCLSSSSKLVRNDYLNELNLGHGFNLYFDSGAELHDLASHVLLFSGILWEGEVEQFIDFSEEAFRPNGQFYCLVFDKQSFEIKIFTDFIEDFPVYYSQHDQEIVVTTKLNSFSNNYFHLNDEWLDQAKSGRYQEMFIEKCSFPQSRSIDYSKNQTVLKNVQRVGHASILKISTYPQLRITKPFQYFTSSDYLNLYSEELDFEEAKKITHQVLTSNLKRIPGDIALCASSGIDSALILSLLVEQKRKFRGFSYSGLDSQREFIKWPESFGIENLEFNLEKYIKSFDKVKHDWIVPSRHGDLAPEMSVIQNFNVSDFSLVKGSYGDEVFWHEPHAAMCVAIHQFGIEDFQKHLDFLRNHYSYQPFQAFKGVFEFVKNLSFQEGIMSYHYFRHSYLKDDKVINNRMIYSPYQDFRLYSLLPKCNRETQVRSILDAELQFSLLSSEVRKYVNKYKSGGEDLLTKVDYKLIKRQQLDWFIENWER